MSGRGDHDVGSDGMGALFFDRGDAERERTHLSRDPSLSHAPGLSKGAARSDSTAGRRIVEALKDLGSGARAWGLTTLAGATLSQQVRSALAKEADREAYYAEAESLGYRRRAAELVLWGIMHMARQEMRPIDALAEARSLLSRGEVPHE